MLPNDFGGEVRTFYRPGGVVCEPTSPVSWLNSDGLGRIDIQRSQIIAAASWMKARK